MFFFVGMYIYIFYMMTADCSWSDAFHDIETTQGGLALEAGHECRYGFVVPCGVGV